MMAVYIQTKPVFKKLAKPRILFQRYDIVSLNPFYDIHPDGDRFLFIQEQVTPEIHVVTNFHEELKRLVPTGN